MIRRVVLHGILKDRYPEMEIAGETPAEVIEGWSRQCGMAEEAVDDRIVIKVLGCRQPEDLNKPLEDEELHLFPAMFGGGAVGRILVGAAMITVGILIAPSMPHLGAALIASGIGMVIGGVMMIFMKSPKIDKSEDPDPSRYIGNAVNSTAIGTPIGLGGGRMMVGGHFLSLQVNATDMVYGRFPA